MVRRLWPTGDLWRHGDFMKLWSAETISQFGTQISQLALPFIAIVVLDASTFAVAPRDRVHTVPRLDRVPSAHDHDDRVSSH